ALQSIGTHLSLEDGLRRSSPCRRLPPSDSTMERFSSIRPLPMFRSLATIAGSLVVVGCFASNPHLESNESANGTSGDATSTTAGTTTASTMATGVTGDVSGSDDSAPSTTDGTSGDDTTEGPAGCPATHTCLSTP